MFFLVCFHFNIHILIVSRKCVYDGSLALSEPWACIIADGKSINFPLPMYSLLHYEKWNNLLQDCLCKLHDQ